MARYELKLPHMGESVAEATITSWLKKVGDTIEADDIIVEVATDKVDSEIPCEVSGVVTEILFDTDQVVQVGQVMAIIETPEASPEKEEILEQNTTTASEIVAEELQQIEKSAQNIVNNTINSTEERFYSPLVKTIAQTENISAEELNQIKGSGQDGRVTKNDILEYVKLRKAGGSIPQSFYQDIKPAEIVSPTANLMENTPIEEIKVDNSWDSWAKASIEETPAQTTEEIKVDNSWDSWAKASIEETPAQTTTEEIKVDNSWDSWAKASIEETPAQTTTEEIKVDNSWDSWAKASIEETPAQTTEEIKADNSWDFWDNWAKDSVAKTTAETPNQVLNTSEEKVVEETSQKADNQPVITTSSETEKQTVVPAFTHKVEFNHQDITNEIVEKTPEVVAPAKFVSENIPTKTPEKQEVKTENIIPPVVKEELKKEEKPSVKQSDDVEVIEMTRMGKLISKYMVESKQKSPHVQSFTEVDVTRIWNWRNKIKKTFEQREGEKFTFTPIFIEAVAKALRDFPMMNISTDGERIFKKKHINIGMATALPNGDLIVPVIKNADTLSLVGLAKTVNDLANRARNNKLKPDDITGGTYTVTNIGSFGNVFGTPIINQPEVGILAIGAIQKVPAVIETPDGDVIGIRYKMMLSHSYDHRVVNGALGGMFVQRVAEYLEKWNTERDI